MVEINYFGPETGPKRKSTSEKVKYHHAREHGFWWFILNECLHIMVLGYNLLGLIKFNTKLITNVKFVNTLKYLCISYNCYLYLKFTLIAIGMLLFNIPMAKSLPPQYNCSLENEQLLYDVQSNITDSFLIFSFMPLSTPGEGNNNHSGIISELEYQAMYRSFEFENIAYLRVFTYGRNRQEQIRINQKTWSIVKTMARMLHNWAGPLKLAGLPAAVLYSFMSVCMFIILIIFPLELLFGYKKVSMNFTRFVLGDKKLIDEFHHNRDEQYNLAKDFLLKTMKTTKHGHTTDHHRLINVNSVGSTSLESIFMSVTNPNYQSSRCPRTKKLKRLDHQKKQQAALDNCKKFTPFVRTAKWFRISMIVYTCFIISYFTSLLGLLLYIGNHLINSMQSINIQCIESFGPSVDLMSNWSPYELITYYELIYGMIIVAAGSSFYCSYYYGTMIELYFWLLELEQQLTLSKLILMFEDWEGLPPELRLADRSLLECMIQKYNVTLEQVEGQANHFGGLKSFYFCIMYRFLKWSDRRKMDDITAANLLERKDTVLRASLMNYNLVMKEISQTRNILDIIIGRSAIILLAFAGLAAIAEAQFARNFIAHTWLSIMALFILDCYLLVAAFINRRMLNIRTKIHLLLPKTTKTGSRPDIKNHLLKQIKNLEVNDSCYTLLNQNITFPRIFIFNVTIWGIYNYTNFAESMGF